MKAKGGKERVLYTTHSAAYDAKTRSGLAEELPLAWASVAHIFGASDAPKAQAPKAEQPVETETKGLHFAVIRALGKDYDWADAEGYMLSLGRIEAGQSWMDASEQLLERISENPEGFKAKVAAWKGGQ
jgi:DNA-binding IclR family transcriptional regulator